MHAQQIITFVQYVKFEEELSKSLDMIVTHVCWLDLFTFEDLFYQIKYRIL